MARIRGYMAASLDGFIADRDGGVDWLEPYNSPDFGYEAFVEDITTIVMERKSYEQVRAFGPDWTYKGKRCLVVTSREIDDLPDDITCWTKGITELVDHLRGLKGGDVWCLGGAQLQSNLIALNALDSLELFIIPVLLGQGVAMFTDSDHVKTVNMQTLQPFDNGVVRLRYAF